MDLTKIDLWIGKTLFIPPIVKLCQVTRQTQYAVSRLLWFFVALDQLRIAESLGGKIFAGLFCLMMMLSASLRADLPAFSMMWFRMMSLGFLAFDIAHGLHAGHWKGVEIWVLVLFAEYAATIRTLPPADAARKVGKKADAPLG